MLLHGVKHLVAMRVSATAMIVYRVLAVVLGYPAVVFLTTLAARREAPANPEARLPNWPGQWRSVRLCLWSTALCCRRWVCFRHCGAGSALLPVVSVVVVVAILRAARTRQLARVLTGTVIAIYLISGVMDDRRSIDPMNQIGNADRARPVGWRPWMRRRIGQRW